MLSSSVGRPGLNPQSRTASYHRHSALNNKREILTIGENVMDNISDGNPSMSEVIGRCDGDEKKRMTTQNQQKSNAKKIRKK